MIGPHILHFETGESLLDINSAAVIAGYAWGRIFVPVTPLNFSAERARTSAFSEIMSRERLSAEQFYNRCFSGADLATQAHFYDRRIIRESSIDGVVLGLGIPDDAIVDFIQNTIIENVIGNLSLPSYSTSTTNPLLYGMNGYNTFSFDSSIFESGRINFCVVQGVMGAIAEMSMSLLFIGPFNDMAHSTTMFHYLWNMYNNAIAYALVPTASVGFILEGADAKLLFT
jgi:hypothetical protein